MQRWVGGKSAHRSPWWLGASQKADDDGLNNEAQTDMTRLQSLVDRRDESYSTATNLMASISDTRANVIRNM